MMLTAAEVEPSPWLIEELPRLTARGRVWHTPELVDATAAARTRARLQELPVANLLPGHGRPVHSSGVVWPAQRR